MADMVYSEGGRRGRLNLVSKWGGGYRGLIALRVDIFLDKGLFLVSQIEKIQECTTVNCKFLPRHEMISILYRGVRGHLFWGGGTIFGSPPPWQHCVPP